jgi:hypothetical protein
MIRGLNSIYNQAFIPKTDAEKKSFAGYSLCLTEGTKHHHRGVLFPAESLILTVLGRVILFQRSGKTNPGVHASEPRTT